MSKPWEADQPVAAPAASAAPWANDPPVNAAPTPAAAAPWTKDAPVAAAPAPSATLPQDVGTGLPASGSVIGNTFRQLGRDAAGFGSLIGNSAKRTFFAVENQLLDSKLGEMVKDAAGQQATDAARTIATEGADAAAAREAQVAPDVASPVTRFVGQSAVPMVATIAAGAAGGPPAAAAMGGGLTTADTIDAVDRRLREQGMAPEQAHAKAQAVGALAAPVAIAASGFTGAGNSFLAKIAADAAVGVGQDLATQGADYAVTGKPVDLKQTAGAAIGAGVTSVATRGAHVAAGAAKERISPTPPMEPGKLAGLQPQAAPAAAPEPRRALIDAEEAQIDRQEQARPKSPAEVAGPWQNDQPVQPAPSEWTPLNRGAGYDLSAAAPLLGDGVTQPHLDAVLSGTEPGTVATVEGKSGPWELRVGRDDAGRPIVSDFRRPEPVAQQAAPETEPSPNQALKRFQRQSPAFGEAMEGRRQDRLREQERSQYAQEDAEAEARLQEGRDIPQRFPAGGGVPQAPEPRQAFDAALAEGARLDGGRPLYLNGAVIHKTRDGRFVAVDNHGQPIGEPQADPNAAAEAWRNRDEQQPVPPKQPEPNPFEQKLVPSEIADAYRNATDEQLQETADFYNRALDPARNTYADAYAKQFPHHVEIRDVLNAEIARRKQTTEQPAPQAERPVAAQNGEAPLAQEVSAKPAATPPANAPEAPPAAGEAAQQEPPARATPGGSMGEDGRAGTVAEPAPGGNGQKPPTKAERTRTLVAQLRDQVMEHFGTDAATVPSKHPTAIRVGRGELPPGAMVNTAKAMELARTLPEDAPARRTLAELDAVRGKGGARQEVTQQQTESEGIVPPVTEPSGAGRTTPPAEDAPQRPSGNVAQSTERRSRLSVLQDSLKKKESLFDQKLGAHMEDVRSANGQPLNDKANGGQTLERWERQNNTLRNLKESIEKTKQAIEREQAVAANVESADIPEFLKSMVESGELQQWRRNPNTFFVPGVDKGRIVWNAEHGTLSHKFLAEIPKDQYPKFRDAFNKANAATRARQQAAEAPSFEQSAPAESGGQFYEGAPPKTGLFGQTVTPADTGAQQPLAFETERKAIPTPPAERVGSREATKPENTAEMFPAGKEPAEDRHHPDDVMAALTESGIDSKTATETLKKLIAFHGSPHDFDKFDLSKIGTGEGAQAYGHGLYFAEAKDVAEHYRQKLTKYGVDVFVDGHKVASADAEKAAGNDLADAALAYQNARKNGLVKNMDEYVALLRRDATNRYATKRANGHLLKQADVLEANKGRISEQSRDNGTLYQTELAPQEHELLDWDRPLSEQSEFVRDALAKAGIEPHQWTVSVAGNGPEGPLNDHFVYTNRAEAEAEAARYQKAGYEAEAFSREGMERPRTGQDLHDDLMGTGSPAGRYSFKNGGPSSGKEAAARFLRSLGIRGIKYRDGNSRSTGDLAVEKQSGTGRWHVFDKGTGQSYGDFASQAEAEAARPEIERKVVSRNFVIFDDADVNITHKNDVPVQPKEAPGAAAQGQQPADLEGEHPGPEAGGLGHEEGGGGSEAAGAQERPAEEETKLTAPSERNRGSAGVLDPTAAAVRVGEKLAEMEPAKKAREAVQAARDAIDLNPVPKLSRAGVGDEAVEHASAYTSVPHQVNYLLSKVFPEQYHDPEAMSRTMSVLVKDNVLAGHDDFVRKAEDAKLKAEMIQDPGEQIQNLKEELSGHPDDSEIQFDEGAKKAKNAVKRELRYYKRLESDPDFAAAELKGAETTAAEAEAAAKAIEQKHDLEKYDADVKAALSDPTIRGNVDRWKEHVNPYLDQLFNEIKGVDPAMEREGRGRHTGARVNLLAADENGVPLDMAGQPVDPDRADRPANLAVTGSTRNPNVRRDRFDRSASFTGNYSTDPQAVLSEVLGRRWNEVTKLRLYNALQQKGVAVVPPEGTPAPREIGGQRAIPQGIKLPETDPNTGRTRYVEKTMYVRADAFRELRAVLNTDLRGTEHPVAKKLTALQLASPVDLTAHTFNLWRVAANAQGAGSAWKDAVRKLPGVGSVDAVSRIVKTWRDINRDTPEIRAEIARMSQQGLIRPEHPGSGLQKLLGTHHFVQKLDTATRVLMNRFFDDLVSRGLATPTSENRQRYVNQAGQYNRRLMGDWMRRFKDMGISPFIVAGRNFNRQGRRALLGTPGFESPTRAAAAQARATQLLGPVLAVGAVPMMLNTLTTGKLFGRAGTPVGAWDTGRDDEDGRHKVVDFAQMAGIRRGMRGLGVDAALSGLQQGKDLNTIAGNAVTDVLQNAAHPWVGPGLGFLFSTLTGRRLDLRGEMNARKVDEGGLKQYAENARAAFESQNPMLYNGARAIAGAAGMDTGEVSPTNKGFVHTAMTSAGFKSAPKPSSAALDFAYSLAGDREAMTHDEAKAFNEKRQIYNQVRQAPNGTAKVQILRQAVQQQKVSKQEAKLLLERSGMTPLRWALRHLSAEQVMRVWQKASPDERRDIRNDVAKKVLRSQELTPDAKRAAVQQLRQESQQAAAAP